MNDTTLVYYGTDESKRTRYVVEASKEIMALSHGPIINEDIDVNIWRYSYYDECPYIENLVTIREEQLDGWPGRYMVHPDAICWERAISPVHFRYIDRYKSPFWAQ